MKNKIILLALITTSSFLFGGNNSSSGNPFISSSNTGSSVSASFSPSAGQDVSRLIETNHLQHKTIDELRIELKQTKSTYLKWGLTGAGVSLMAGVYFGLKLAVKHPRLLEAVSRS